jgi:cation-transporting ATPase F
MKMTRASAAMTRAAIPIKETSITCKALTTFPETELDPHDAADMVLTDDNFATIEAAVEEGRGVFDNLTKFIAWTLPTNVGEGMVVLVAILLGATLPLMPVQILWINMTTAVALGLMLAFEPKEADIMRRPRVSPASHS